MKKNIRIFGKVAFICLCTICFIWLIHKDKTFFQLKQPQGESIRCEDAAIVMRATLSLLEDKCDEIVLQELEKWTLRMEEKEADKVLLYEAYKSLPAIWKESDAEFYDTYTYKKEYRDDFYLLKKDWYVFFDALLDYYELHDDIKKETVTILTGKENLTGESIGDGYLLTEKGEVVFYRSPEFENCYFSCVTAYVKEMTQTDPKELLTVESKKKKNFTLINVWVMEAEEEKLHLFYKGFEITGFLGEKIKSSEVLREMVSDITFGNGKITQIKQKTTRISGRLLQRNDTELELEGKGGYKLADNVKIYLLYEELREGSLEDLKIGYDFADYVLEDGKICAALIMRKENMENIRVAIKNEGFASLYHDSLTFQADCDMTMVYGAYDNRKKTELAAGEAITIEKGSDYLNGARVELIPEIASGKIQISSLVRNQGIPAYRGKFEITETKEGLILINEVLLEEYLYSVVPSEMPASYPHEALKTQAVCARTYAYRYLHSPGLAHMGAHVDDSVSYQVYNNIAENYHATKAVKETMGELLFHEGEMVDTYYYSTSCGFGADAGIWQEQNKETMPYLKSRHISGAEEEILPENMMTEEIIRDYLFSVNGQDYEAEEGWYRWKYEVTGIEVQDLYERLQTRFNSVPDKILTQKEEDFESLAIQQFNEIYDIIVIKRRAGGVIDELMICTDAGNYKVISEYNVRYILSAGGSIIKQDGVETACGQLLPSAYLVIDIVKDGDIVTGYRIVGGGYGHGVGMSQNAAKTMANQEKSYKEILGFFYQNCDIKKMY